MLFALGLLQRTQPYKRGATVAMGATSIVQLFVLFVVGVTISGLLVRSDAGASEISEAVESPHTDSNFVEQCGGRDRLAPDTQDMINALLHWVGTSDCGDITPLHLEQFLNWQQLYRDNHCASCNLSDLNLAGLDLIGTALRWSDLSGANLRETDLVQANLSYAQIRGADLSGADLESGLLSHADLTHANLSHVNLMHTTLTGANLTDANLTGANLTHADLTNANLANANLLNANWDGAIRQNTNLCGATLPDGTIAICP